VFRELWSGWNHGPTSSSILGRLLLVVLFGVLCLLLGEEVSAKEFSIRIDDGQTQGIENLTFRFGFFDFGCLLLLPRLASSSISEPGGTTLRFLRASFFLRLIMSSEGVGEEGAEAASALLAAGSSGAAAAAAEGALASGCSIFLFPDW
jgi:hypothetical protein